MNAALLLLDTPQKSLKAFLNAWKQKQWMAMYSGCQATWKWRQPNGVAYLRGMYGNKELIRFGAFEEIREGFTVSPDAPTPLTAATVADFRVPVQYRNLLTHDRDLLLKDAPIETVYLKVRIIREAGAYKPTTEKGGYWGVNPLSALREEPAPPSLFEETPNEHQTAR